MPCDCGFERQFNALHADYNLLDQDCTAKRRQIARLKDELAKATKTDDLLPQIDDCFDYWVGVCRPRSRAKLGAKTTKLIGDRLRERIKADDTVEEAVAYLKTAIDGAADDAFVNDKGKRFDDIELICRDDAKLRSFYARREATLAKQQGASIMDILIVACGMPVSHGAGDVRFQCPCCCMVWAEHKPFRPLLVRPDGWMRCFACNADEIEIRAYLTREHIVAAHQAADAERHPERHLKAVA